MRHQDKCGVLVEYTVGRVCNTRTWGGPQRGVEHQGGGVQVNAGNCILNICSHWLVFRCDMTTSASEHCFVYTFQLQLSDYKQKQSDWCTLKVQREGNGATWHKKHQEKFYYTFYPRSRKRFVGAESDVNVISAVTCCIIVWILHFLGTLTVKQYLNHKSQSSSSDFLWRVCLHWAIYWSRSKSGNLKTKR